MRRKGRDRMKDILSLYPEKRSTNVIEQSLSIDNELSLYIIALVDSDISLILSN